MGNTRIELVRWQAGEPSSWNYCFLKKNGLAELGGVLGCTWETKAEEFWGVDSLGCVVAYSQKQVEMLFECLYSRNTFFQEEILIGITFPLVSISFGGFPTLFSVSSFVVSHHVFTLEVLETSDLLSKIWDMMSNKAVLVNNRYFIILKFFLTL